MSEPRLSESLQVAFGFKGVAQRYSKSAWAYIFSHLRDTEKPSVYLSG